MICIQCGAPLSAGDPFCPKCGARQSVGLPVPSDPQRAALERALGHQYDILRLLGRGGMGAVYLAREKALERTVAIKVLPPDTATDADTRERFRREARTAAKLTHPNIVPLLSFGDVDGMLYFVMGYVKGESLAERMRREGKLPEEDVRRILAEVADALHYAHKQGVVHRDIKPDNILIDDESGRPMLTDFGVAKARASGTTLTEAGAVVGTPYYMSPEQASGAREIDGRSDLYSLGVMGYQMLSGRLPFEGESFQDVIVQHVTQAPVPLAALTPDAPPDLVEAVMRCLAKEPAKRCADGRQLRDAIAGGSANNDDDPTKPGYLVRSGPGNIGHLITVTACSAMLAWASYLYPTLQFMNGGSWWGIPAVIVGIYLLLGGVMSASSERGHGLPWRTILRFALYPPRWWSGWWPERWRMPGDVWERLPQNVRRWRIVTSAVNAVGLPIAVALFLKMLQPLFGPPGPVSNLLVNLVPAMAISLVALAVGPVVLLQRWGMARGLAQYEASQLASTATWKLDFWRKPSVAALLRPPADRAKSPEAVEPKSPVDLANAIRDLIGQLPSNTRATVSEAGDASRQVAELVVSLDAELINLARDADPQELEAIESKLRALGPEAHDEGEMRREKRALLVHQRELHHRLDQRLADVNDRRSKLVEMLRTMWLQLATLRAEAAHDTLAVTEISGRIKALCTDIDAHLKAAESVRVELR